MQPGTVLSPHDILLGTGTCLWAGLGGLAAPEILGSCSVLVCQASRGLPPAPAQTLAVGHSRITRARVVYGRAEHLPHRLSGPLSLQYLLSGSF